MGKRCWETVKTSFTISLAPLRKSRGSRLNRWICILQSKQLIGMMNCTAIDARFFGRPYAISIHHPVRKTIYIYLARRYLARWQEILASLNKPLPL